MISSDKLAAETGATLRQLQWWDERKILVPAGGISGHKRIYSDEQIDIARRIVALRREGVSLCMVRKCLAIPGWKAALAVNDTMIVGDVLLVPAPASAYQRRNPAPRPVKRSPGVRFSSNVSDSELDAIALRDPRIASKRK